MVIVVFMASRVRHREQVGAQACSGGREGRRVPSLPTEGNEQRAKSLGHAPLVRSWRRHLGSSYFVE